MVKHLVTITCTRDKKQMILQSYSIKKFVLAPCIHWVFIEDTATPLEEWHKILDIYYKGIHTLKIIKLEGNENIGGGWFRQEVGKLEAFRYINDGYITLDTKNFFFRDTHLDWKINEGHGLISDTNFNNFDDFINLCSKRLNLPIPKFLHSQDTPFKYQKSIIEKIQKVNFTELINEARQSNIMPCEQVIYDFFSDTTYSEYHVSNEYRKENLIYYTWWWNDGIRDDDFEKIINSKIEILALSRNVWLVKNEKIERVGNWLINEFGFDPTIIKDNLINLMWDPNELCHRQAPFSEEEIIKLDTGAPGEI